MSSSAHAPTETQRAAVMNVLALMLSDRRATDEEMRVLEMVRRRVKMSEADFLDLLAHPRQTHFVVPKSEKERLCQLRDMALMIVADGRVNDDQVTTALSAAAHFGVEPNLMIELIRKAQQDRDQLFRSAEEEADVEVVKK